MCYKPRQKQLTVRWTNPEGDIKVDKWSPYSAADARSILHLLGDEHEPVHAC